MTVEEAKAKIFHWLCSRYHDPGRGNEYIDKDMVREAINIPEEVFEKALNEFVDPGAHDCVEVEIPTGRLKLGTGGLQFCEAGTNPFTQAQNKSGPAGAIEIFNEVTLSNIQRATEVFFLSTMKNRPAQAV